jgi:hypothetical protein
MPFVAGYEPQQAAAPPLDEAAYPEPEYVETTSLPPPEYVESAPAEQAPAQQAAPQEAAAPPSGVVRYAEGSAPTATPPPARAQAQTAPPSGGVVGAIKAAPAAALGVVKGAPGAISEFTGVGRENTGGYRPADPNVAGESQAAYQAQTAEAQKGLEAAAAQGPGNALNILGAAKDVGLTYLSQNKGEVSPERANQVRWTTERLADEIQHGDPFYSKPDRDIVEQTSWDKLMGNSDYAIWARANPDLFLESLEKGYTTPDNLVWAPGLDAPWEVYQSKNSGIVRGLSDISMAPVGAAADAAATLATLGGTKIAIEAAEQALRYGAKTAGKEAFGKGVAL